MISTQVVNLLQLSKTRFLALLAEERARVDRWADPGASGQDRQGEGVSSARLESFHRRRVLAILDRSGKIRTRAAAEPDEQEGTSADGSAALVRRRQQPLLLALEDADACPYAVVERAPGQLLCYDFALSLRSRLPLGLSYVYGARAFFEGDAAVLWIFGTPSPPPCSPPTPGRQESSLGVRVQLTAAAPRVAPLVAPALAKELEDAFGGASEGPPPERGFRGYPVSRR